MFYAHFVLAKKGPLAKIWLAAHWDKKLTKAHVFETNIEKSVDGILKPKVKMALRTSGHLLLGVVRIYSRKAKYLLQDCNEAFVKIKMAFRPGMVDLPEEHREAAMNAITLPEVFHDFDTAMPELNEVDIEAQFSLNQSRAEEITMREDYGSLNLVTHDDGFGDMGFDTDNPDIMREAMGSEGALEQSNLLFADGSSLELGGKDNGISESITNRVVAALGVPHERRMETAPHTIDDGFGGGIEDVGDFGHAGGLFEGDLFGDVTPSGPGTVSAPGIPGSSAQAQSLQAEIEAAGVAGPEPGVQPPPGVPDSDDDMDDHYDAGTSPQHSWDGSPPHEMAAEHPMNTASELMPPPSVPQPPSEIPMELDGVVGGTIEDTPRPAETAAAEQAIDQDNTTLIQNDEESFALAPVDATVLKGITKTKRKRKLIVDEVKNISGEEMKNQLSNTSDIVTTLDLAPPTRRLMHWKETGGVERLFTLPARSIPSRVLFKKYQRNMTIRSEIEEAEARELEVARRGSPDHEQQPARRSGRKRKHEEIIPPETPAQPEIEPPTPVALTYEPSVDQYDVGPDTPGYPFSNQSEADIDAPPTPGGILSSLSAPLTPAGLGPLTPGGLLQGGLTPGGLTHGGMTPVGLHHGGLTPAGLQHGEAFQPGDISLPSGGMTPIGMRSGGMTPSSLHHGGLDHGSILQRGQEMPMMPHLPGEQVSSLLGDAGATVAATPASAHELDHTVPMEPLPLPLHMDPHTPYQGDIQMANLGFDDNQQHSSPHHDYDLPPSVEHPEDGEREAGETDEQFEERVLNRRAAQLLAAMRPKMASGKELTFRDLAPPHNSRKQVAQKFYCLLVLKKHQVLTLKQDETYGPIAISKGSEFEIDSI